MLLRLAKRIAYRVLPGSLLRRVQLWYHTRAISKFKIEEEPDLAIVRHLVRQGEFAIDAGANLGIYTRFLSEFVGIEGKVISFEPIPDTYDLLTELRRRLQLKNVNCHQRALSNKSALVAMQIPHFKDGVENFYQAKVVVGPAEDGNRTVEVRSEMLDSFTKDAGRPVAFVKCDVEGHERECIEGAIATIERDHPSWLVELSGKIDEPDSPTSALVQFFAKHGYGVYWYDGNQLRKRMKGEMSINHFFLRKEHLSRIAEAGLLHSSAAAV